MSHPEYIRSRRHPHLFKKPGSARWYCFLPNPDGGRALQRSTGQRDESEAHRVYLELLRPAVSPEAHSAKKQVTVGDALQSRIDWLEIGRLNDDPTRKKRSADTIDFYTKKSRQLVRCLGADTLLSELDSDAIKGYIEQRTREGSKGRTIGYELTTLSTAVDLARKDSKVEAPSIRDLKPDDFQTVYVPRKRWLTRTEAKLVIGHPHLLNERKRAVAFIIATGATFPSEVGYMTAELVDPKKYIVHIPGTKRETRDREFVIPSDRRDYFDMAMRGAPSSGQLFEPWNNANRDILTVCTYLSMCSQCNASRNINWIRGTGYRPDCKRCQAKKIFEPFAPVDLRRTFAKWLALAGVPYQLAYPLMGHKDDRMLKEVYGKRSATEAAGLIEDVLARGDGLRT